MATVGSWYSNVPRSGALPENGNPTFSPLSIKSLLFASFRKSMSGKLPSSFHGPNTLAVSMLKKSPDDTVTPGKSHELWDASISLPVALAMLPFNEMLFLKMPRLVLMT